MSDHTYFDGGCACGGVRYRLTAEPMFVNCCHCRWCQRETGSAFVLNAVIETSVITVTKGAPVTILIPSESGNGQKIIRCPDCQIALWSHYSGSGEAIAFARVGTLDNPDRFPPNAHIFTATKQPWISLDGKIPVFEGYFDLEDLWPDESLARRRAAIEKHGIPRP